MFAPLRVLPFMTAIVVSQSARTVLHGMLAGSLIAHLRVEFS